MSRQTRPVPAPVPPPNPGPTGWTYAKRAAAILAALIVFVGLLGFTSARVFEVVLRIDPDFSSGVWTRVSHSASRPCSPLLPSGYQVRQLLL